MNKNVDNVGAMIEKIIRSRGICITKFANDICCSRENVYKIFGRNSIDIELLARISKVLKHNFFEDIANNLNLALPIELDKDEEERQKAICQFFDVMPKIMERHHYDGNITFASKTEEERDIPLPDFILSPHLITFTIGETIEDRLNGKLSQVLKFQNVTDNKGNAVLFCDSKCTQTQFIDIKLDYKTESKWEETFLLAIETANRYFNAKTKAEIEYAKNFTNIFF